MSREKFRDEELKFLKDQHEKAKAALRDVENTKARLASEVRDLTVSEGNVR